MLLQFTRQPKAAEQVCERIMETPNETQRCVCSTDGRPSICLTFVLCPIANSPQIRGVSAIPTDAAFVNAFDDLQAQTLLSWDPDIQVLELGPKNRHDF